MRTRIVVPLTATLAGIFFLTAILSARGRAPAPVPAPSTPRGFPVDRPSPAADAETAPPAPPAVGPNGKPLEDLEGRDLRAPGLDLPRPIEPATDAAGWAARMADADRRWGDELTDAALRHAASAGWSTAEQAEVRRALLTYVERMIQTRQSVRSGAIAPAEGRRGYAAHRAEVRQALDAAIGVERAEALRAALTDQVAGGSW